MTGLLTLSLPILVSAVLVFAVSSVIHMMSPWHKSDYPKLSNEDRVMDALRPLAIPPYAVVVGCFAGYVAGRALPPGAPFRSVFRFAAATAFVGYALALWQMSIWYRRSWLTTIKATVDGLIYALLTGATLGWLWPR